MVVVILYHDHAVRRPDLQRSRAVLVRVELQAGGGKALLWHNALDCLHAAQCRPGVAADVQAANVAAQARQSAEQGPHAAPSVARRTQWRPDIWLPEIWRLKIRNCGGYRVLLRAGMVLNTLSPYR